MGQLELYTRTLFRLPRVHVWRRRWIAPRDGTVSMRRASGLASARALHALVYGGTVPVQRRHLHVGNDVPAAPRCAWTVANSAGAPHKKRRELTPEDLLVRRVNGLVGERKAAEAVETVRAALRGTWEPPVMNAASSSLEREEKVCCRRPVFSCKALAAALFACESVGEATTGLSLVAEVRRHTSGDVGTDWFHTEHVLSVILRLQCMAGDQAGAAHMFAYLEQHSLLRLRTASAYLRYCCKELRDRRLAFAVYEAALKHKIELMECDYVELGKLCWQVCEPIGTLFFILQEMREHVSEVSEEMVQNVLKPWVSVANKDTTNNGGNVAAMPVMYSLQRVEEMHHLHQSPDPVLSLVEAGVTVRGICPACQRELSGYPFTRACRSRLLRELEEVVIPQACRHRRAQLGFTHWKRYIESRHAAGDRVDVFIDGANLGYYGLSSWYHLAKKELMLHRGVPEGRITPNDLDFNAQCKAEGCSVDVGVNFELIDSAVRLAVHSYGFRRPLVMLHERHVEPKFMTAASSAIVQRWREKGWLYCTPTGLNDDLCWLHGALLLTDPTDAPATTPAPATPSPPGAAAAVHHPHRTFVCTNDKMRDHHFCLLSPRAFTRWRDRHRIAFRCVRVEDRTELLWDLPAPYERCIQFHDGPPNSQRAAVLHTSRSLEGVRQSSEHVSSTFAAEAAVVHIPISSPSPATLDLSTEATSEASAAEVPADEAEHEGAADSSSSARRWVCLTKHVLKA